MFVWTFYFVGGGGCATNTMAGMRASDECSPSLSLCTDPSVCVCSDVVPRFVLMDIQGDVCNTYVYELHGEDVKVDRMEFKKSK